MFYMGNVVIMIQQYIQYIMSEHLICTHALFKRTQKNVPSCKRGTLVLLRSESHNKLKRLSNEAKMDYYSVDSERPTVTL